MSFERDLIATIDFEASGFSGYPIEVGVAIYTAGRDHISLWSSLIKPTVSWLQTLSWDPVAEQIHGICRHELKSAQTPWIVADQINELLAPCQIAYCDGCKFDLRWLNLLINECPTPCLFELRDASALARLTGIIPRSLFEEDLNRPPLHRAGPDAERLLRQALNFH